MYRLCSALHFSVISCEFDALAIVLPLAVALVADTPLHRTTAMISGNLSDYGFGMSFTCMVVKPMMRFVIGLVTDCDDGLLAASS